MKKGLKNERNSLCKCVNACMCVSVCSSVCVCRVLQTTIVRVRVCSVVFGRGRFHRPAIGRCHDWPAKPRGGRRREASERVAAIGRCVGAPPARARRSHRQSEPSIQTERSVSELEIALPLYLSLSQFRIPARRRLRQVNDRTLDRMGHCSDLCPSLRG